MRTPYFSRREVLTFLLNEARNIEAGTESECWDSVWRAFFPNADDLRHDGYFLEFERVCQFYGFGPTQESDHLWRMRNVNLRTVTL